MMREKNLKELLKKGAKIELLEGLDGFIGKEIYSAIVGLWNLSTSRLFFSQIFPEDQHHVHRFPFQVIVEHNPGSFELRGSDRLFISELESDDDISAFNRWVDYYEQDKDRLDDFFKQETEEKSDVDIQ